MTSSIRAFDRAQDAYNLAKKSAVQQKTVVFVVPKVRVGPFKAEVRFPWEGKIVDVYASTGTAGTTSTTIQIEKCSQDDYDTVPVWVDVLAQAAVFDPNEKSLRTSSAPYALADETVKAGDHFRINTLALGDGFQDLTLEITIQI